MEITQDILDRVCNFIRTDVGGNKYPITHTLQADDGSLYVGFLLPVRGTNEIKYLPKFQYLYPVQVFSIFQAIERNSQ